MKPWEDEFRQRLRSFELRHAPTGGDAAVSVKVRVTSGCFHREHSPEAYALIDQHLASIPGEQRDFVFEEHESGPEILLLVTAALGLTREVVSLLGAIIKARHEGVERGDGPSEPVEVIVRRMDQGGNVREEMLMRIGHRDSVDEAKLVEALRESRVLDARAGEEGPSPGL